MRASLLVAFATLCFLCEAGNIPHSGRQLRIFPDDWYGKDNWATNIQEGIDRDNQEQAGYWLEGLNKTHHALRNFIDVMDEAADSRRLLPRLVPRRRRLEMEEEARQSLTKAARRSLPKDARRSLTQDSAQHVAVNDFRDAMDSADIPDSWYDSFTDPIGAISEAYDDAVEWVEDTAIPFVANSASAALDFAGDIVDYSAAFADDVIEGAGELYTDVVQVADEWVSVNVFGNEPQTIDSRPFPRIEPECRYDDSTGLPGVACLINVELSRLAVIQIGLNIEFGLSEGGESVIAKLSTGVKTQSVPESCSVFETLDPTRSIFLLPCTIAEEAASYFQENICDLGGLLHPIMEESIQVFPFQLRFPGKFSSGLISDSYPLITLDLVPVTALAFAEGEGICMSTLHQNSGLVDWQTYTMQAAAVMLNLFGGDLCFRTTVDMDNINESGELQFGMHVSATLFERSQMSFTTVIDFLPEFLDSTVDAIRPYIDDTLDLAMQFVKSELPEEISYEVDVFKELLMLMEESEAGATTTGFTPEVVAAEALLNEDGTLSSNSGDDTCKYHFDGVCDEPKYCAAGTDHSDCRGNLLLNPDGAVEGNSVDESVLKKFSESDDRGEFLQNYVIEVGSSAVNPTKVVAPVVGLICPELVTHHNWVHKRAGVHIGLQDTESFKVEVVANRITVTRTDSDMGWDMDVAFNCFQGFPTNYYRHVHGVGHWGGTCTCPDGHRYQVGDNGDSCESLACEGGVSGECGEGLIESTAHAMKVTCASPTGNWYRRHNDVGGWDGESPGGWGGICTCPNGRLFNYSRTVLLAFFQCPFSHKLYTLFRPIVRSGRQ
jgi:hypothetical protein